MFSALHLPTVHGLSSTSVLEAIIMARAAAGVGHELIQIYPNDNQGPQTWGFDWKRSSRMVREKFEDSGVLLKLYVMQKSQMSYRVR